MHAKRYSLTLNKNKCTGCGICTEICPREAIEITRTPKAEGEEAKPPTATVSEEKCNYCGMCEAICPFGALTSTTAMSKELQTKSGKRLQETVENRFPSEAEKDV